MTRATLQKADGVYLCGKCGKDEFRSDETLWGYVRCTSCDELYSHPYMEEVTREELLGDGK